MAVTSLIHAFSPVAMAADDRVRDGRGALAASGGVKQLRRWTSVPKPPDA
jgi:hypothetical protein